MRQPVVNDLTVLRVDFGFTDRQWNGILGSAFRGNRPWFSTAIARFRWSLIRSASSLNRIEQLLTAIIQQSPFADPVAGAHPNLVTPQRRIHILEGDHLGGGHRFGAGIPGKTEFPAWWIDERIIGNISAIYTDPVIQWTQQEGPGAGTIHNGPGNTLPHILTNAGNHVRYRTTVDRDRVQIRVAAKPGLAEILSGFPIRNGGRGVYTNPE